MPRGIVFLATAGDPFGQDMTLTWALAPLLALALVGYVILRTAWPTLENAASDRLNASEWETE